MSHRAVNITDDCPPDNVLIAGLYLFHCPPNNIHIAGPYRWSIYIIPSERWKQGFIILCVPARRSNQSILNEISPGCSLEGLMLKLKLQYFGHLMWRADSFEKTLMLGKIERRRKRGRQRMRWLDGITDSMDMMDQEAVLVCWSPWSCKESDMTERLNWLTDNDFINKIPNDEAFSFPRINPFGYVIWIFY